MLSVNAQKVIAVLQANDGQGATRTDLGQRARLVRSDLDAALKELFEADPPLVIVKTITRLTGKGSGTTIYRLKD